MSMRHLHKRLTCDIIKTYIIEDFMEYNMENVIDNIDFSMKMEDMPLTNEDKSRLRG
jgi:hypothetical protein